ncbi:thiosulfate sulfurtransferase/rhodanese-like domain-containing protein 1 isoform X1 [Mizuhopecten yessoensis]|uniref:thiosulfate sulfurtransferase/rhodanese-like domain-containing protein 1 isoform X1 n=1 Tax=Mizuhopecten yessoensis TaxID=6573 RepID=UPI000B45C421|nr:thiosulfate sulfurtransferase/rhodanese-like domain-containing protein 1 isoform X1 [Mizuhopecten yessoensis]
MAGVSPMSRLFQRRQVWNILKLINKQSSFAAVRVSTPKACATLHGKCSKVQGQVQKDFRRHDSNCVKRTDVNFDDIISLLGSGSLQLIDVREPSELVQQGEFPTALNIPLSCLKETLQLKEEHFTEMFNTSKPRQHDEDIVFVGFGPIKSNTALEIAHKMGFKKARQYAGGFKEWMEKTAEGEI